MIADNDCTSFRPIAMSKTKWKFAFNPVAAYRQHGQRYSIYVATQLAVTIGLLILAAISIWGGFFDIRSIDLSYQVAIFLTKAVSIGMIYLALELLYWKARFSNLKRQAQVRLTDSNRCG